MLKFVELIFEFSVRILGDFIGFIEDNRIQIVMFFGVIGTIIAEVILFSDADVVTVGDMLLAGGLGFVLGCIIGLLFSFLIVIVPTIMVWGFWVGLVLLIVFAAYLGVAEVLKLIVWTRS